MVAESPSKVSPPSAAQADDRYAHRLERLRAIVDAAVKQSSRRSELASTLLDTLMATGWFEQAQDRVESAVESDDAPGGQDLQALARGIDPMAFVSGAPDTTSRRQRVMTKATDEVCLLMALGWRAPAPVMIEEPHDSAGQPVYRLCTLADIYRQVPKDLLGPCLADVHTLLSALHDVDTAMVDEAAPAESRLPPALPMCVNWSEHGTPRGKVLNAFGIVGMTVDLNAGPEAPAEARPETTQAPPPSVDSGGQR